MIKDIENQNESVTSNTKQLLALKEHFAACFKADGSFDVERFKAEISNKTNVINEGYELKFLGKSYAKLLASTDTTTVIQPNEAHNSLPENANSENIYISGDNLDGLKHLLKSYSKSIKCIYIDPPYNTGGDGFVYFDNFSYTKDSLQEKLSVNEEEAERILELTKRGSASHSAWLMFMYSRLLLARDLLTDDGVIFISIDDNEQANLKLLCDDVFGEENFVANIAWHKNYASANDAKNFSNVLDAILVYSRTDQFSRNLLPRTDKQDTLYKYDSNDGKGKWRSDNLSVKTYSANYDFPIINPNTGNSYSPPKGRSWVTNKENIVKWIAEGRIFFGQDGKGAPQLKRYLVEVQQGIVPITYWSYDEVGHNDEARKEIKNLFEEPPFDTPKPTRLIKRCINIGAGKYDIVLDFFSGSATTADAVMQLNAQDGGMRKVILIQLQEKLNKKDGSKKIASEFLEQNKLPTTLDYIGIERIKRAAAQIKEAQQKSKTQEDGPLFKDDAPNQLDLGFKHYILSEPDQKTLDKLESFDSSIMLADSSVLDDFGKPTILSTWLNADGYGLTAKVEAVNLAGYTAYYHQKHLYLIDPGFTLESMKALLSKYDAEGHFNPDNLVLFGYSFPDWSINEMIDKNLRILNDGEKNLKINYNVRY